MKSSIFSYLQPTRSGGPIGRNPRRNPRLYVKLPTLRSWFSSIYGPTLGPIVTDPQSKIWSSSRASRRKFHEIFKAKFRPWIIQQCQQSSLSVCDETWTSIQTCTASQGQRSNQLHQLSWTLQSVLLTFKVYQFEFVIQRRHCGRHPKRADPPVKDERNCGHRITDDAVNSAPNKISPRKLGALDQSRASFVVVSATVPLLLHANIRPPSISGVSTSTPGAHKLFLFLNSIFPPFSNFLSKELFHGQRSLWGWMRPFTTKIGYF